jgi:hypothetical protein
MGPAGTGKTTSLTTLLAEGLNVRLLATEPSAPNRVLEEARKRNISTERFHWRFVSPSSPSWNSLISSAETVNTKTLKQMADMSDGIAKSDGKQYIEFLKTIQNFISDRDGSVLGDATLWGDDTAFVIDGLTGINFMSRNLAVGLKPNPSPGEWGVMQSTVLNLIRKLCADCNCFFVLIGHVERETNELTGVSNVTVSTLGAKLAPKLPPEFTNVVLAKRTGAAFHWSVADQGVDTKPGDLEFKDNLVPSFAPIVSAYRNRLSAVRDTSKAEGLSAPPVTQTASAKTA